jgi:hypothetical protein
MADAPLRPDLQRLLDELDAVDRATERLVSPLTDEQFFWQPNEGRSWSVAQCLEHLAMINAMYGAAVAKGIESARARGLTGGGPIELPLLGGLFVRSMEPPVKRRFRAPGKAIPRTTKPRADIMRAFAEGHRVLRDVIRAAAEVDVNRGRFANPFLGFIRWTIGTGISVGPAHDRRHLWQAENVTKAPGFPTAH